MATNNISEAVLNYWQGRQCNKVDGKKVQEQADGAVFHPALKATSAAELFAVACNVVHEAHSNFDETLARKWFSGRVNVDDVRRKTHDLHESLRTTPLNVRFAKNKEVLGAYDPDFQSSSAPGELVAQLGGPILSARYSWGEKVMTLLHEMSHIILKTIDIGSLNPRPPFNTLGACYGPFALQLAQNGLKDLPSSLTWDKAISNAENWGYFLISHYEKINSVDYLVRPAEFTHLDDKTLKDYNSYVKGRPAIADLDESICDMT